MIAINSDAYAAMIDGDMLDRIGHPTTHSSTHDAQVG